MITIGVNRHGSGFEKKWPEFIEARGARVKMLDLLQLDALDQVRDCDAVMWHWHHDPDHKQSARTILSVMETEMGKPVFPSIRASWHFDDKIAQLYLFQAHSIPSAATWLFWNADTARAWASTATYPVVAKLSCGAGSSNVSLIHDAAAAHAWISQMFSRRGVLPDAGLPPRTPAWRRCVEAAKRSVLPSRHFWKPEKNYALFQEFLPDNPFDTRITVIGNRAFGYRRFNRPNDFRASGSGNFNVDPEAIDPRCVRLAFDAAAKLGDQSIAFDFLFRGPERTPVILEVSYGYVSWMVESCPGHWDRDLKWHAGRMWPEEAHVADLLQRISKPCAA